MQAIPVLLHLGILTITLIAGATSQQFTPTTAGTYYVEVSTGATCLGRDTINISQVLQLSVSVNDLFLL